MEMIDGQGWEESKKLVARVFFCYDNGSRAPARRNHAEKKAPAEVRP